MDQLRDLAGTWGDLDLGGGGNSDDASETGGHGACSHQIKVANCARVFPDCTTNRMVNEVHQIVFKAKGVKMQRKMQLLQCATKG